MVVTHEVQSGETLESIASRFGVTTSEILRVNEIPDPRRLRGTDSDQDPHNDHSSNGPVSSLSAILPLLVEISCWYFPQTGSYQRIK